VVELGAKNRFLAGRLQVNAAYYHSLYDGYQISRTIPAAFVGATTTGVFNGGSVKIDGGELDLLFQLTQADRFEVSGNYTDGRFTSITVTGTTAQVGYAVPQTARFSGNLAYTHIFTLRLGKVSARAETHLESSSWLSLNHNAITAQGSYTKSNLTLAYNADKGGYTASAWVRNIENRAVRGNVYETANNETVTLGTPRTYGVSLSRTF
jgi:iron complex outermembrane receptor protein